MTLPAGWRLKPALSMDAWAQVNHQAGFRGEHLAESVAVVFAESSGIPNQRNVNTDKHHTTDRGGWQINDYWHPEVSDAQADDPLQAAKAAYRISKGGKDFSPWTTWPAAARKKLTAARAAADRVESGGAPAPAEASSSASSTPPATLSGDVIAGTPGIEVRAVKPTTQVGGVQVIGKTLYDLGLADFVTAARLSMSTQETDELSLTLEGLYTMAKPDLSGFLDVGFPVRWYDLTLVVASTDEGAGSGLQSLSVACRPDAVEQLRRIDPLGKSRVWSNLSATEVAADLARAVGMRFIGKGTLRRATITRTGAADAKSSGTAEAKGESEWELLQRLAKEEGFWCFECAGVLCFAPPTWLVSRTPRLTLPMFGFNLPDAPYDAPKFHKTIDLDKKVTFVIEAEFLVGRHRGEAVRPGMSVRYPGKPLLLVTDVTVDYADSVSPVVVRAVLPTDPVATAPGGVEPTTKDGATSSEPAATGAATGTKNANDFVNFALKQVGDHYSLQGGHPSSNVEDPDTFDCSGLVGWAAGRAGVNFTGTARSLIDKSLPCSVEQAKVTRGALLFHPPTSKGTTGHIVICLGDGSTVEARGSKYGVVKASVEGRGFSRAGLVPGLDYGPAGKRASSGKPTAA